MHSMLEQNRPQEAETREIATKMHFGVWQNFPKVAQRPCQGGASKRPKTAHLREIATKSTLQPPGAGRANRLQVALKPRENTCLRDFEAKKGVFLNPRARKSRKNAVKIMLPISAGPLRTSPRYKGQRPANTKRTLGLGPLPGKAPISCYLQYLRARGPLLI